MRSMGRRPVSQLRVPHSTALRRQTTGCGLAAERSFDERHPSDATNVTRRAEREAEHCVQTHPKQIRKRAVGALKTQIRGFFTQFRVIRRALRHPHVPWYAKAGLGCCVLYVVSPIQLIPNFIPVIGQMDDVLVVILGIKFLRKCVPPHVLEELQNESPAPVGISTNLKGSVPNPLPNSKS
jgi:uncharacterized membrane protein YkvA (DUF1232 family)